MANSEVAIDFKNDSEADFAERLRLNQQGLIFDARFWRCHRLLHFIAGRILGDPEQAQKAVENCRHSAFARAPHFEYEGAFRSWLVRVLIDEALVLLRERIATPTPKVLCESVPAQASGETTYSTERATLAPTTRIDFHKSFPWLSNSEKKRHLEEGTNLK